MFIEINSLEDLSCDNIPLGPFESPPLKLTVCMHYACPLKLTVLTLSLLALSSETISALHCSALKLTALSYKRPFEPHGNYLSNDHLIIENIYSS